LFFNAKENRSVSKNSKRGTLIIKRLERSGEENRQPAIREKRIKDFLLSTIYWNVGRLK